jgi:hypothetical protein
MVLKGPKLEIFPVEFFAKFKPVWVDDLGNKKIKLFYVRGLIFNRPDLYPALAPLSWILRIYLCTWYSLVFKIFDWVCIMHIA